MKPILLLFTNPLYLIGLLAFVLWLVYRSPLLAWLVKLALLIGWGAATVGITLYFAIGTYLPRREYFAAILTVLSMGVMILLWFAAGLPEIIKALRDAKAGLKLWKE